MNKAELWEALGGLHAAHAPDAVMSIMTGFSRQYVRTVLDTMGLREKWHNIEGFRSNLAQDLVNKCDRLQNRNKTPSKL